MKIRKLIKRVIRKTVGDSKSEKDISSGKLGENIACVFLSHEGYRIIEKNFRTRFGEIDIIAENNKTICFIEVKARSGTGYGLPEEFVDERKQEKLVKTALGYITSRNINSADMRFDIVSVDLVNESCRIIQNAFYG